jgi:hypothetical protein
MENFEDEMAKPQVEPMAVKGTAKEDKPKKSKKNNGSNK